MSNEEDTKDTKDTQNTTPDTQEDKLPELREVVLELDAATVARVYTVAAMSGWTPDVEDPFEAIEGTVKIDARIVGQAYILAVANGWQPADDDPLALLLMEKGILKINEEAKN